MFDSVIFCAGMQDRVGDQWMVQDWHRFIKINAIGQLLLYEELESLNKLATEHSIILVSSFLARSGSPWCPGYAASKAVMESYWKSKLLQKKGSGKCPRVNTILPGRVETPSNPQRLGVTLKPVESVVPHVFYLLDNDDVRNQTLDAGA